MSTPFRMGQIGRHGAVYALGMLLNKSISLIMLPVYTRFMTPGDYGVLQLITMTNEVASIVAGSRIASGVFRYYSKAESPQAKRAVIATAMTMLGGSFALIASLEYMFAPQFAEFILGDAQYATLLRIAAGSMACEMFFMVPMVYIQVQRKSRLYVAVSATRLVMQAALNAIFLIPFHMGAQGVVLSGLISNATLGVFLGTYLFRGVGFRHSREAARDLLRYGIPLIGMQVATFVLTFGDRYFLNKAADTHAVGIYGLAYQFGFLLAVLGYLPFSLIWDPVRFDLAKGNDRDRHYARAFLYMNLGVITIAVGIALSVDDLLRIVASPGFRAAAPLVPIILLAYVLQCWSNFQNLGILVKERTEYLAAANWIAAGIALVGYVWLIPIWQGMGAAITTLVAFAARQVMVYGFAQWLWPVRYQWGPVLRLSAAGCAVVLLQVALPEMHLIASIIAKAGLFVLYGALVWTLRVLSDGDRRFVRALVRAPRATLAGVGK